MATRTELKAFSVEELKEFLSRQMGNEILEECLESLERNRVSGMTFLELGDDDLRELFPLLGQRKAIKRLISSYKPKQLQVCEPAMLGSHASSTWLHKFQVPEHFSRRTMEAIALGSITRGVRIEVVGAVVVEMMRYTSTPTSQEYCGVCSKLVAMYPTLKDTIGTGYGSWKEQLRNKFKNIRRHTVSAEASKRGEKSTSSTTNDIALTTQATKKRARHTMPETDTVTDATYEELCEELTTEVSKERPSKKRVRKLMRESFHKRRHWILSDSPSIEAVCDVFPPLRTKKYLWRELVAVTGTDPEDTGLETWCSIKPRVVQLAAKEGETRNSIRTMQKEQHHEIEKYQTEGEEVKDLHILELLYCLLTVRPQAKVVYRIPGSSQMEDELKKIRNNWPYFLCVCHDFSFQLFIIAEKQVLVEVTTPWDGLKCLLGAYFTFNIEYPRHLKAFFIFIQHHIFNLKDSQNSPNIVTQVKSSLDRHTF